MSSKVPNQIDGLDGVPCIWWILDTTINGSGWTQDHTGLTHKVGGADPSFDPIGHISIQVQDRPKTILIMNPTQIGIMVTTIYSYSTLLAIPISF